MSGSEQDDRASDGAHAAREAVGYGKPPVASRFQPGRSGNPRGRPRKPRRDYRSPDAAPWLGEIVLDEAYRAVQVRENGKTLTLTAVETVVRALAVGGAKGSRLHAKLLLDRLADAERHSEERRQAVLITALRYKADWTEVCRIAAERGQYAPVPPLPHPDDLQIDMTTGVVTVDGPQTLRQQRAVERLLEQRDGLVDVLRGIGEQTLCDPPDPTLAADAGLLARRVAEIDARLPQRLQLDAPPSWPNRRT